MPDQLSLFDEEEAKRRKKQEQLDEQLQGFLAVFHFPMDIQTLQQRYEAIEARANQERAALLAEVMERREFADGQLMRGTKDYGDGTGVVLTATIVGAKVNLYGWTMPTYGQMTGGYPRILYSVRIESPDDYDSRQSSSVHNIEMGKYEDFWEGDDRWVAI